MHVAAQGWARWVPAGTTACETTHSMCNTEKKINMYTFSKYTFQKDAVCPITHLEHHDIALPWQGPLERRHLAGKVPGPEAYAVPRKCMHRHVAVEPRLQRAKPARPVHQVVEVDRVEAWEAQHHASAGSLGGEVGSPGDRHGPGDPGQQLRGDRHNRRRRPAEKVLFGQVEAVGRPVEALCVERVYT